jgi:serine/threonine-protein phosphatase 2A regulatory subunit B'
LQVFALAVVAQVLFFISFLPAKGVNLFPVLWQVAERALFLWNNEHLFDMISQNRQVIVPLVYPALERNARLHWNQSVLNVTMNVRKMFFDMDERLLLACQSNFQVEEEKRASTEERRRLIWEQLEQNAEAAFQPANASFPAAPSSPPPVVPTAT